MTAVVKGETHRPQVGTVEEALAVFRNRGGRITHSRRLLLKVLFDDPTERTAEELAEEIHRVAPEISLSTVYRNLDDLENFGVVVHAHLGHGPAVYSLAALARGHLVCEACGAVIDIPAELFDGLANTARSRFDFDIHPHHFAILGRCHNCRSSERSRSPRPSQSGQPSPRPPMPVTPGNSATQAGAPGRTMRRR